MNVTIDPKTLKPDLGKTIKSTVPQPEKKNAAPSPDDAVDAPPDTVASTSTLSDPPPAPPAGGNDTPDENGMTAQPWRLRFIGDGTRRLRGQPMQDVSRPAHEAQRMIASGLYVREPDGVA